MNTSTLEELKKMTEMEIDLDGLEQVKTSSLDEMGEEDLQLVSGGSVACTPGVIVFPLWPYYFRKSKRNSRHKSTKSKRWAPILL